MKNISLNPELSKFQKLILNKIITGFEINIDFNIYDLVNTAISCKHILPSEHVLVMETYFRLKEFLVFNEFVIEKKEMIAYTLTGKGKSLKKCSSIELFEKKELKKKKGSVIHWLLDWYNNNRRFFSVKINEEETTRYE